MRTGREGLRVFLRILSLMSLGALILPALGWLLGEEEVHHRSVLPADTTRHWDAALSEDAAPTPLSSREVLEWVEEGATLVPPGRPMNGAPGVGPNHGLRWTEHPESGDLRAAALALTDELEGASEAQARRLVRRLLALSKRLGPAMDHGLRLRLLGLVTEFEPVELRAGLGTALAEGGRDPDTTRALLAHLADSDLDVPTHEALCAALAGAGGAGVVRDLLESIRPREAKRSVHVARALRRIGGPEAELGLLGLLQGRLGPVARAAVEEACAGLESQTLNGYLGQALPEAEAQVAVSMLRVLEARGDSRQSAVVLAVLDRSEQAEVKHAAVRALGTFADDASVDRLLGLVNRADPYARSAETAIMKLCSPSALDRAAAAWTSLGPNGRHALLHAAARQPKPSPAILRVAALALDGQDVRLHAEARGLLGRTD